MVKLAEINRTSTFAWSHSSLPLLVTGTVAGAVDANFSLSSILELWLVFNPLENEKDKPLVSLNVEARFHALAWLKPFGKHTEGLIAGGLEDGTVEFWDASVLLSTKDLKKASVLRLTAHSGPVKTLLFHPTQNHVMVSGGSKGQILVWDLETKAEPTGPGQAMTPMDEISSVAWNKQVPHIFASTGNSGYTSVWDLKAKREVLHLLYLGSLGRANFSSVAWHPTLSTKLVTASDNDGCPLILTWDLRNANAPETIMQGHTKGVLSLDWCAHDPELLISSGKDNATFLWNPITGQKLGEYPTTANWAFKTEFAPAAPDLFATALFDGKILVQLLQDTSPPAAQVTKSKNDNDFWNEISTTDTQQPVFEVKQAPLWLKRPSSVSFGFGSKLATVKTENGKSVVTVTKIPLLKNLKTEKLSSALNSNNFVEFIGEKSKSSSHINDTVKSDWQLLEKLLTGEKSQILNLESESSSGKDDVDDATKGATKDEESALAEEDSFFDNLGSGKITKIAPAYTPSGDFKLFTKSSKKGDDDSEDDSQLLKLILAGKIDQAVTSSIEQGKLVEALILALDGSEDSKNAVKNEYFRKNKSNALSRILYSATSKNVTDIVSNADVSDWKEIAACISAYAVDAQDYNDKITELGDRILELEKYPREDALRCYLAGNALDKISSIWLKELPDIQQSLLKSSDSGVSSPADARFEALNEFAEKFVSYRSISKLQTSLDGPSAESVCKALLEYASIVASYGEFELASKFLELLPADFTGLKLEKDRIAHALGKTAITTSTKIPGASPSKLGGLSSRYARAGVVPTATNSFVRSPVTLHAKAAAPPFAGRANGIPPPVNGGFQPAAPSSYAPMAQVHPTKPASNPYAPKGPVVTGYHNPYAPQVPTVPLVPLASAVLAALVAPPPPPPVGAARKEEGWNDLPETFKPKIAPRSRAVASPPIGSPAIPQLPPAGPKRTASSATLPPPPKGVNRTVSKLSVASDSTEGTGAESGLPSTKYAPPVGSSLSLGNGSATNSPRIGSQSLPPKNPYAPPPAPLVSKTSFVSPTPPLVSTPSFSRATPPPQPKNPYAPQPDNLAPVSTGIVPPPNHFGSLAAQQSQFGAVPPPPQGFAAPPPQGFAPPPPSNGFSGSVAPPPQAAAIPPPPKASGAASGSGLPSTDVSKSTAPVPTEVESKFPAGDRTHIPEGALPIYTTLNTLFELIRPTLPAQYAKHGEAVTKRLNILYDHLNNQDLLSTETIEELKEVCSKLEAKDYPGALALHVELATKHSDETGNWYPGVKHLIQMAEALE